MKSMLSSSNLARASASHPWRVLGIWLLAIVLGAGASGALSGNLTDEVKLTNDPESQRAGQLLEDRLRGPDPSTETVIVRSDTATVDDPAFREVVERTTFALLANADLVKSATNYYAAHDAGDPAAERLVSADRRTTLIPVTLAGDRTYVVEHASDYADLIDQQGGDGIEVLSVGAASGADTYGEIGEEDLAKAETFGFPIALLVLVLVFGALVAAVLPMLLGVATIMVALGLTGLVSAGVDMSTQVTTIITMLGLAVGIDYALFVVQRYREERRHGWPKLDAIALAGGTAGKAVVFSGGTVVVALMGMFLIPVSIFQSFGIGAGLAVVVAVVATQTLIPALLGLLGDKVDWPRRRHYDRVAAHPRTTNGARTYHGLWGKVAHAVMLRPWQFGALAVGIMVAATIPNGLMETGQAGIETLPESEVKTAYEILDQEFYAGLIAPVEIVVDGDAADPAVRTGVDSLVSALGADPLFGPATVATNQAGDLTLVSVPMAADGNSDEAYDAIASLRETTIPAAFAGAPAEVLVGGSTATTTDFNAILDDYTPVVFAFVLGLSFVLLLLAFRSLVVPLTSIVMNMLSVGAAYGALVLVFQKGYGADLLGFVETPTIEAWIPIFLFAILFGLSMDYHVFLLSRIREHYDQTGNNTESVAAGLQATGKVITGAAAIMVAVFAGFASGQIVTIQQMGFGLAVAVFLDATLVRSILVPAVMRLLGDGNWWLPRGLGWLPDLRIEGAPTSHPSAHHAPGD